MISLYGNPGYHQNNKDSSLYLFTKQVWGAILIGVNRA